MAFFTILIWIAVYLAAELLRPKPEFENARPSGIGDFQFPTATEGRAVPIIWGTVKQTAPNVIWYGNLRSIPVTEEVKTGIFSSEDVVIGYKYYVGIDFAICRGPGAERAGLWINDKIVGTGAGGAAGSHEFEIDAPDVFGGEDQGSGGVIGDASWYDGDLDTQAQNAYLSGQLGTVPAYRGTCHVVFEGGYVGTSPSMPAWAWEVMRIPNGLGLDPDDAKLNQTQFGYYGDANLMNVLYEILTDTEWGLGIDVSEIDAPNLVEAAETLAGEDNGFSMLLDNEMQAATLIDEIQRQADGILYFDREAGLWRFKLARDDYNPASIPSLDESNIVSMNNYARQTWSETTNQVRVAFFDRTKEYKRTFAAAQDMANATIQQQAVPADVNFPGVKDATLANSLAWRELKTLAYPLAKLEIIVNRTVYNLKPGDVFKFSWARLGITDMVFRVGKIGFGGLTDGDIKINTMQDIFAAGAGSFSDPIGSGWGNPWDDLTAPAANDTLVLEAPRQMIIQDPYNPELLPRAWCGARAPGGGTTSLRVYSKSAASRPIGGDFAADAPISRFLLVGELEDALAAYGANATRPATNYSIDITDNDPDSLDPIEYVGEASTVRSLITLAYIGDLGGVGEYVGFHTLTDIGGSIMRLASIYRGLLHTSPRAHPAGTRVWFLGLSGGNLTRLVMGSDDELDVQLRGAGHDGETSEGGTPTKELSIANLYYTPLGPRDPLLDSVYAPSTTTVDTQYVSETGLQGDDARALEIEVTPRNWRLDDVISDLTLDAGWDADSPEFDFLLTLDPDGIDVDIPLINISGTQTPTAYLLRNQMIEALGSTVEIPDNARITVTSKHDPTGVGGGVITNPVDMVFDFDVTSVLQGVELIFGAFAVSATTSDAIVFNESGTYNFDIHYALPSSGILEANVNGGGFVTVVGAGVSTGTLVITATDSVVLRFSVAPAADQFFDITGPTSETGYGVLLA